MLTGHCHCGRIAFEVDGDLPKQLTRCTCSFCSKRGHLNARLVDGIEAADWPVTVIDGKYLW